MVLPTKNGHFSYGKIVEEKSLEVDTLGDEFEEPEAMAHPGHRSRSALGETGLLKGFGWDFLGGLGDFLDKILMGFRFICFFYWIVTGLIAVTRELIRFLWEFMCFLWKVDPSNKTTETKEEVGTNGVASDTVMPSPFEMLLSKLHIAS